jgi:CheY-like chemotaxis protein
MPDETRRQILWADDEIDLLRPHIKFLEQKGFEVTAVPNGEDALAELARRRYDVVLLDEMMPGLGGLGTLGAIKSRDVSVPVILVTKSEEESLMDEAIGRQISDYLIKPVNPSQVFLACKRVLESQRLLDTRRTRDYVEDMRRWQNLDTRRLDWAAWVELAVEMARWDVTFDALPGEEGLQQAHQDFRRSLNLDFGRFIEQSYSGWVHGGEGRPMLSTDVVASAVAPLLRRGRRVVLVVIDCLRLDQWLTLEPLLEEHFELRRAHYCSILPTATPYSRNAIFSGLLPAELHARHPEMWQESGADDRTKNRYERQFLELQLDRLRARPTRPVKYLKIYDAEEAQQARRQASTFSGLGLLALVYNFSDILAHGRSESELLQELAPDEAAFRSVMRAWFLHSPLYDVLRALSQQDCTVVLTTDHGAVLARRAARVHGNRDTSTSLRYKFGLNLNCDAKEAVILRRPGEFRLPEDGVNKNYILAREDYFFVYPTRFHEYERQFRGSFQHGGISIEEMVLPLVTMTPRRS